MVLDRVARWQVLLGELVVSLLRGEMLHPFVSCCLKADLISLLSGELKENKEWGYSSSSTAKNSSVYAMSSVHRKVYCPNMAKYTRRRIINDPLSRAAVGPQR